MWNKKYNISNKRIYEESKIFIYRGYSEEMKELEEEKVLNLIVVDNMGYMPLYLIEVLEEEKLLEEKYSKLFDISLEKSQELI
jgi:hypothetical protein